MKSNFSLRISLKPLLVLALSFLAQITSAQFTVSGRLETPSGGAMGGFAILVTGTENKVVYTNSGNYSFTLQEGGAYNIRPLDCKENPLNGVSTYDLVLISKHIAGIEPLSSPYKIIAADIDNSNTTVLEDTLALRNLILGLNTELPNGNFRFVLKNYVFPDPLDPFTPAFPESYSISNLETDLTGIDFVAIKKGDVNNTWITTAGCGDPDLPAKITGHIYQDENDDCQLNANEPGMERWIVSATDGSTTYYGKSGANGAYEIGVLPGTYEVSLSNPDELWGGCTATYSNVSVTLLNEGVANFGLQPIILCPAMQVELSTAFLRRCFDNYYKVQYCNNGTITAENARVELKLDSFYTLLSSTIPWSNVNGNTYTFELGDVPAATCGDFLVRFNLSCDAVLGQTHCTEAQIFPDSSCSAQGAWSGAQLKARGYCDGNEVKFIIENKGANMATPSNYIVVEDILVMTPPVNNPFTLLAGNSEIITVPANGATWRLEAEQPVGYPWGQVASATVEGCGLNSAGKFSLGFVNLFPQDDQAPIIDIDCQENSGSFDPNDKQGFPTGVLTEHYIPLATPIDYLIRFQNTGTDTAFTVVIRDTLDADLDVLSIRPTGGSHPYTFNLIGENVAQFVFANILLPDSNVNEAASHGYIKFNISPKKDVLNGAVVENQAAIFFDFNDPVITNKTTHTLGEKYLDVSNVVFSPGVSLEVFPNPASEQATFLLKSISPINGTLSVYNMSGQIVKTMDFDHNQFDFSCKTLPSGCYFFKIAADGQALASGKLVVTGK